MTFEEKLQQYAQIAIRTGINLKKDQPLHISCPIECAYFARLLTKEAYKAGASDVYVDYSDEELTLIRFENAPEKAFDEFPKWKVLEREMAIDKGTAFLSISASNPELLKSIDSSLTARNAKARSIALDNFSKRLMSNESQWLVVSLPTKAFAKKVFPDKTEEDAINSLWNHIFYAVRIDGKDPVKNWENHTKNLTEKVDFLNKNKFKEIQIVTDKGTDIRVELPKDHVWQGGGSKTQKGHSFIPNMPTEEVFTMPHKDGVNGIVKSAKPLNYNGNLIENFSITFENGKAIKVTAEKGEKVLQDLVNTDEGSRSLGEIALVPFHSPISDLNTIFYNTLFDENASCHFALGRCYTENIKNGDNMSKEELAEKGGNYSLIHVDFMFGDSSCKILGITHEGKEVWIFKNGDYAI